MNTGAHKICYTNEQHHERKKERKKERKRKHLCKRNKVKIKYYPLKMMQHFKREGVMINTPSLLFHP
jgi:hypothetical protein